MRIIVTGCRDWDEDFDEEPTVSRELEKHWRFDNEYVLMVGDCPTGVDRLARDWFRSMGRLLNEERAGRMTVWAANWKLHGKSAGPRRNQAMVDAGADLCLAFWDGESRGTLDCLTRCVKAGIPVRIIPKGAK